MIGSEIGQAAFRIGMYIVVVSGLLTWFTEPGTSAHVISLFTLIIGLLFLLIIAILVRTNQRK